MRMTHQAQIEDVVDLEVRGYGEPDIEWKIADEAHGGCM